MNFIAGKELEKEIAAFPYSLWLDVRFCAAKIPPSFIHATGIQACKTVIFGTQALFAFGSEEDYNLFLDYLESLDLYMEGDLCQLLQKKSG